MKIIMSIVFLVGGFAVLLGWIPVNERIITASIFLAIALLYQIQYRVEEK